MVLVDVEGTRSLVEKALTADLVVVGGGLSGVCCAITAAREGVKVLLVQDRPVLGGNASSEVRLWVLGATSHMGNNNRWAREGGVIDEILTENLWRNRLGNPVIFDSVLLEKVIVEPNIHLLLNTAVSEVTIDKSGKILAAKAFCSQNQTRYTMSAPLFCDCSGDGIVGFLAGAAFRIGAEDRDEFGEGFAPPASYGELLGHSLYFYSRDTGRPVRYVAPGFALKRIEDIPRYKELQPDDSGCRLWWLEYGGRRDTVLDTEEIKWELWRVAYGVWDYIKNSGRFPEAENLTLEWMGTIPGKRESRRFEGDYILCQQDIVEQRQHLDAVSFGGWAMDLHPADGVYSDLAGCTQWHAKGVYQIPYRTLYSRNVPNLFLGGRLISATHVAFGSTRVMATCGHNGQAVGVAAALCREERLLPRDLLDTEWMWAMQQRLLRRGQYIPPLAYREEKNLAASASVEVSSTRVLDAIPPCEENETLDFPHALLLPLPAGRTPTFTFCLSAEKASTVTFELRVSENPSNYTPERTVGRQYVDLAAGGHRLVTVDFGVDLAVEQYAFVTLLQAPSVRFRLSDTRLPGILTCKQALNAAVAKSSRQSPPENIGVDTFDFWLPSRRPRGKNPAVRVNPPIPIYSSAMLRNGISRPYLRTNMWVPEENDPRPCIELRWESKQHIRRIELSFDTDFDHPMETVLMEHPEDAMPFCVKSYRLVIPNGRMVYENLNNHLARNIIEMPEAIETDELTLEIVETHGGPAAVYDFRCYA